MANWYVSSTRYTAVAQWAASTAYTLGQIVRQLASPAVGSERCFRCSTAGTSGASEPSWGTGYNTTTTDNTAHWTECTGRAAYNGDGGGSAWGAPSARLMNLINNFDNWALAGDNVYLANDHAETTSSAETINFASYGLATLNVISVSPATIPPTTGSAGASITTTGASGLNVWNSSCAVYCYGITFNVGTGSSAANMEWCFNQNGYYTVCDTCTFNLLTTATSYLLIGGSYGSCYAEFRNCAFTFGAAGDYIAFNVGIFKLIGCTFAGSGTLPTTLFQFSARADVWATSCDFSNISGTLVGNTGNVSALFKASYCKLNASVTPASITAFGSAVSFHDCDSGATNYEYKFYSLFGTVLTSTSVYRSGGFTDGTTPQSWQVAASSNVTVGVAAPFATEDMAVWNDNTAATGATVHLTSSVPLTNAQVWLEVDYLGASGSSLGTTTSSRVSSVIGTGAALTTDGSTWTGAQTYVYKITVPISPAQKGPVRARLYVAAETTAFYLDPMLTVA